MKLRVDDLAAHLDRGLASIYLISGAEPLLVQEAGDAVRGAARGRGFCERERLAVEPGFDWQSLNFVCQNRSLFAERRIIELQMESASPGTNGSKALTAYAADPPDDTLLLVICGKLEAAAQRSRWVSALEQAGAWVQVWPVEPGRLPAWIGQRMRGHGLLPDADALRMMSERVEGNLLAAAQEIEKLAVVVPPGTVTAEDVVRAVGDSARFQLFDLADAALGGDVARVVRVLAGLRDEGVEPVLIVWSLVREIRACAEMSADIEGGVSLTQALAKHRVWERRKKLLAGALRRHSQVDWWRLLKQGARLDRVVKGAERGSAWDELLQLAMGICGAGFVVAREPGEIE
jgi:DNA polymerase-3 subunit delta